MRCNQQTCLLAVPEQRTCMHLIGDYNWRTDEAHCLPVERNNSQSFIEF